jgi:hypothetical protein
MRKIGIIIGIIIGIFFVIRIRAANTLDVSIAFSPPQIFLSSNIPLTNTISVDAGTLKVGYLHLVLVYNSSLVHMNGGFTGISPIWNIIKSTPTEIILGLKPENVSVAPTGKIDVANISWISVTDAPNQQIDVSIDKNNSQIVTMDAQNTILNIQDATININQTTPSPTPTDPTLIPTPTPTPPSPINTSSPSSSPLPIGYGLIGNYFNGNNFDNWILKRLDSTVNFNWRRSSPDNLINRDHFAVRWSGFFYAATSGQYTFYTTSDDGDRLWINNQPIISDWRKHSVKEKFGNIYLDGGYWYPIKLEYFENTGVSEINLLYSGPNIPKQIIPSNLLLP